MQEPTRVPLARARAHVLGKQGLGADRLAGVALADRVEAAMVGRPAAFLAPIPHGAR